MISFEGAPSGIHMYEYIVAHLKILRIFMKNGMYTISIITAGCSISYNLNKNSKYQRLNVENILSLNVHCKCPSSIKNINTCMPIYLFRLRRR